MFPAREWSIVLIGACETRDPLPASKGDLRRSELLLRRTFASRTRSLGRSVASAAPWFFFNIDWMMDNLASDLSTAQSSINRIFAWISPGGAVAIGGGISFPSIMGEDRLISKVEE
ncbi:hypothetical protein MRB53_029634 [Persea americana]|uniref:Uncharacterized protein n=1 Tax=Persea americana TaxID=3435 RepID=A0ACC2KIY0_PERAE|nr:hypothetical protein MRB53_029634 [Persea americana]